MQNKVLIIGTGTIGLPLIGLLTRHKDKFGIDEVLFNKNTPLEHDSAQIRQMIKLGAKLVTDAEKFDGFRALGMNPACTKEEAIQNATVVIDCTPKGIGIQNKREYYDKYKDKVKGFIAQGSEFGFGKMFAHNITALDEDDQFVHVVSCNTHSIAAIIKSFEYPNGLLQGVASGDFVCMRRANDISQNTGFTPSIELGKHNDERFGTHHARDAFYLLQDQFPCTRLYSSAIKTNTQYMHSIRFNLMLDIDHSAKLRCLEAAVEQLEKNPMVAMTNKITANEVFSFGRDYGLYGRLLSQTVICRPTLSVRQATDSNIAVCGMAFTPQDGNSLLSSIAATLHFIDPETVQEKLAHYNPYIFQEI